MARLAVVRSPDGDLFIDYETGAIRDVDPAMTGPLLDVCQFELPERKSSEYQITDLSYWMKDGKYVLRV